MAEADDVISSNQTRVVASTPLSFATCLAGAVAVFTMGSFLNVVGASQAFSFPFYLYFEPADYLRIAPTWGVIILLAALNVGIGIAILPLLPREPLPPAGFTLGCTVLPAIGLVVSLLFYLILIGHPGHRAGVADGILFFGFLLIVNVMALLEKGLGSLSPWISDYMPGARRTFFRLTPAILVRSQWLLIRPIQMHRSFV